MSEELHRLARMVGIEPDYIALNGAIKHISDEGLRANLKAMGIAAENAEDIAASLAATPAVALGPMQAPGGVTCFVPEWLKDGRCWGVTCQLYGLRSERNWGIGDLADLARYAEIAAAAGADFVGVNPLHALYLAAPERYSPFSPSSRQFLNPLYIAIDQAPGYAAIADALEPPADIRSAALVDYPRVAPLKKQALERLFRIFQARASDDDAGDFERFCVERGQPLYLHALFETVSGIMAEKGRGATWHSWPAKYRHPGTKTVRTLADKQAETVTFHCWLQWLAERQLGAAQQRALAAGMRIGLYLDLAVGVSPDGSSTWSDRDLMVPGARIGAPPDYFNAAGQDWGLAPLSPTALVARDFAPYREAMDTILQHGGALRIDHAMSLYRLFWIADGCHASDGAYVRYPFQRMLTTLAEVSQARRSIVIGEDLGVVPPGFRDVMQELDIQSYRVFFFEKHGDRFIAPEDYPREALACITTHDLHTLAGWWSANDLRTRHAIGMIHADALPGQLAERAHERRRLLGMLYDRGMLAPELEAVMRGEAEPPPALPGSIAAGLYALVARAPSRLFGVPAEDLTGAIEQVNIPGTMGEHPNWRRKLGVELDDLPAHPVFQAITEALRSERPKPG